MSENTVKQTPRKPLGESPVPEKSVGRDGRILLEKLYRKHWKNLCHALLRRYGKGPPDPEDVAQATFERISTLKGLEKLRNPHGFLLTVAGRIFIDETRRRAVSDKYIDGLLNIQGMSVEEITPERVYIAREDFKKILNDLQEFNPKLREVVLRHRVLGQNYDEISQATGLSPATISRYLKAAMTAVFNNNNPHEEGE